MATCHAAQVIRMIHDAHRSGDLKHREARMMLDELFSLSVAECDDVHRNLSPDEMITVIRYGTRDYLTGMFSPLKKHYEKMLQIFEKAAFKDPSELHALVNMLQQLECFVQIEMGRVDAQRRLGEICAEDKADENMEARAIDCFLKAVEAGDVESMYLLGQLYGDHHRKCYNQEQSVQWYDQAAIKGWLPAQRWLQKYYLSGMFHFDSQKAFQYAMMAAEQRDVDAMYYVANAMISGFGTTRDETTGEAWLAETLKSDALTRESPLAKAWSQHHAINWEKLQATEELPAALRNRAEEGDAGAIFEIGDRMTKGKGIGKDRELGVQLVQAAAILGHDEAYLWLYRWYRGEEKKELMIRWAMRGMSLNRKSVMYSFVLDCYDGWNLLVNRSLAAYWGYRSYLAGDRLRFKFKKKYVTHDPKAARYIIRDGTSQFEFVIVEEEEIRLPEVEGLDEEQAKAAVREMGYRPMVRYCFDSTYDLNQVINCEPWEDQICIYVNAPFTRADVREWLQSDGKPPVEGKLWQSDTAYEAFYAYPEKRNLEKAFPVLCVRMKIPEDFAALDAERTTVRGRLFTNRMLAAENGKCEDGCDVCIDAAPVGSAESVDKARCYWYEIPDRQYGHLDLDTVAYDMSNQEGTHITFYLPTSSKWLDYKEQRPRAQFGIESAIYDINGRHKYESFFFEMKFVPDHFEIVRLGNGGNSPVPIVH